ncbi:MAG: 30S ribosomal protein S12 methylthiotransferase RimO [Phycisphaerales bacterium]|nr:30S ribosomal protein S12 methylthiotransferase RimO [Phycisphaerales bacterium]
MPKNPKKSSHRPPAGEAVNTVAFVSLGCPKNLVDSEKMLGLLAESGITPVSINPESGGFDGADAVVVNTCGFLEASKDESLGVIKEAIAEKEKGNLKRVIVAGCLVQRHRAKMLEWAPGIDAMVGVFDRDKIVDAVRGPETPRASRPANAIEASDQPAYWIAGNALQAAKARGMATTGLTVNGKDGQGVGYFEDDSARLRLTPRHYAYLRVSEGCNQNCAFCTIPSIRGKMRSKPIDRICAEARELINDGAFELLLIGQDTTSYGDDIGMGLAQGQGLPALLRALSKTMDDEGCRGWLRLMYAYPSNFSGPIVDAFAELSSRGRLLKYLDIPLQHASDRTLASMRRHVTRQRQAELIHTLRDRIPGMAIRTTFISGFPGETEEDHRQLLEFVEEMRFDAVGVFEYSKEPGTVAGTMEEDPALAVPAEVKARRRGEIMELQQRLAFEQAASLARRFDEKNPAGSGARFDVVIDEPLRSAGRKTSGVGDGGRLYRGRAYFQAPQIDSVTFVQSRDKLAPGEVLPCVVVGSDGYDLIARPASEVEKKVGLKVLR